MLDYVLVVTVIASSESRRCDGTVGDIETDQLDILSSVHDLDLRARRRKALVTIYEVVKEIAHTGTCCCCRRHRVVREP